jgi:hypothetical protein
LILHSFTETTLLDSTLESTVVAGEDGRTSYTSMLEVLEEAIGHVNPIVTIGSPFPTGRYTLRVEVADSNWRSACAALLPKCKAIIILPEATTSLTAELDWIVESDLWMKTLVVVPCFARKHVDRWDVIRAALEVKGLQLPPYDNQGILYLANHDLSPRIAHRLYDLESGGGRNIDCDHLRRRIQSALDDITGRMGVYGVPLKDAIEDVIHLEAPLTLRRILARQIDRYESLGFPGRRRGVSRRGEF